MPDDRAMNTEEFTGHLLAALHGPRAHEIAERVFILVSECFGNMTEEQVEEIAKPARAFFDSVAERIEAVESLAYTNAIVALGGDIDVNSREKTEDRLRVRRAGLQMLAELTRSDMAKMGGPAPSMRDFLHLDDGEIERPTA